ncbi:MAG: hydantoinase/oxoprolinase family protein, partial [Candidatus Acidiferrales bacterium]
KMDFSKHVLFAYGGNGGLFACGVAEKAGLSKVHLFSLGPVFSAFGSSVSGVCHVYERSLPSVRISEESIAEMRRQLEEMKAEGAKDLLGEGIQPKGLSFTVELDVARNGGRSSPVAVEETALKNPQDLIAALARSLAGGAKSEDLSVELIRLRMNKKMPAPRIVESQLESADGSRARIGSRAVGWGGAGGQAQIYRWESLKPGNQITGCAVIEGINSTQIIPEGWTIEMDRFGNGTSTRDSKQ